MSSPLAPVLANVFMGHHENIWLETYRASNNLIYHCYVDDTFCVFETEQDALLFFDFINTRHPNIRFTVEKDVDHKLPFLDVFIHNRSPGPTTTVFRKKIFPGLLTNYFSFTALSYKIGLVRTLFDRTFKINNTWSGFHNAVKHLTFILRKNLFLTALIDKVLNQYITRAQTP